MDIKASYSVGTGSIYIASHEFFVPFVTCLIVLHPKLTCDVKGLPSVAHSTQVKVVQWNGGHATEESKPTMVYFSVFP